MQNKHIPLEYLRASESQRRELLSGLLDTDGYATPAGQIGFVTTNAALASGIHELVCSLGYRATLSPGRAKLRGRDCGPKWTLNWTTTEEVFCLERKRVMHRERCRPPQGERLRYRYVVNVRPVESRPVRCIQVEHPSGMFLAGRQMIPTHNSTLAKVYARRQWTMGRYIRVIDPGTDGRQGEYARLAHDVGGVVVRVAPGSGVRLNPLASESDRYELLRSVARSALPRPLSPREPALLNAALTDVIEEHPAREPTIPAVVKVLLSPTDSMAKHLLPTAYESAGDDAWERQARARAQVAEEARDVALALQPLCEGDLAGMFDGPTSVNIDFRNRFVSIDLSEVRDSASFGILLACAQAFMQAAIDRQRLAHQRTNQPLPKTILIVDEAWRIFAVPGVALWLQTQVKIARKLGQSLILVMHRKSDLDAAGDDGSQTSKIIRGLLEDTSTFVLFRLEGDELAATAEMFGLSTPQRQIVGSLQPGEALWLVGGHPFVVATTVMDDELPLTFTDESMSVR